MSIRKQETITALSILGVNSSEIHFLDKSDGKLQDLNLEENQQTITQISELLKYYQPEEIYVPHCKDCHQDHEASYRLVKDAITGSGNYIRSITVSYLAILESANVYHIKITRYDACLSSFYSTVQGKKHQAIAAYPSQINSLPNGFIQRFLSAEEIFFKVEL